MIVTLSIYEHTAGFYLENFFLGGGGGKLYICMGGAHSEREDFAKSSQRDVTFGSYSINLTTREKVSVHWGN